MYCKVWRGSWALIELGEMVQVEQDTRDKLGVD